MALTDSAQFWDEKYQNNEVNWDMKSFTPVFNDLLDGNEFIKPGRILITGCGKGYDAVSGCRERL